RPGVVPKLQGPFDVEPSPDAEDDLDAQLTDVYVIGARLDVEDLMGGEDEDLVADEADGEEGLSLSVLCLLSVSGQVRVCLDLEGVEAQWLPPRTKSKKASRLLAEYDPPSLLAFQTINVLAEGEAHERGWPMFSPDITSRYSFFVTHASSITYVSLAPWVFRLETELRGDSREGSDFRIGLLANGKSSTRERLFAQPTSDP